MASSVAVGIDLGTTFSSVSVFRNGNAYVIANQDRNRLTPSLVFYDPKNGNVSVGVTADRLYPTCPKNGIAGAKRFIGRQYEDDFISKYTNSAMGYISLTSTQDGQAAFEIEISGKKVIKKPEEVSSEILKYLKASAETYLGQPVTKAVISVPAYFSNAQRKATEIAAKLAGLQVLKLVTEPTAAAIRYTSDRKKKSNILVFDLGGGTFDISVIQVENDKFEVKAVYGDPLLGGINFDEVLFNHFYGPITDMKNENFATRKFKRRLHSECKELKEALSISTEFTTYIDLYNGKDNLELHMTRELFDQLCSGLFQKITNILKLCLNETKTSIDEVVLVGGSTRIPKIQELLRSIFGAEKIKTDLNPDEAVAAGASIYAAMLTGESIDLEKFTVIEVTPMSLGTNVKGDLMKVFIKRHARIPAKASNTFCTSFNDQNAMEIAIYEGERKNVKYNNELGNLLIENLSAGKAGTVRVVVTFKLDDDGILNVTAQENVKGIAKKLAITLRQFRLSDTKINRSLEEAKQHEEEDKTFEEFTTKHVNIMTEMNSILYDLNKIPTPSERRVVEKHCKKLLTELPRIKEINELTRKYIVCKAIVSRIVQKHLKFYLKY